MIRILSPRLVVLLLVIEVIALPASAQSLIEQQFNVNMLPLDAGGVFEYDVIANRADPNMVTAFDSWPKNDTGLYVGSYVEESSFRWRHAVEEPTKAWARFVLADPLEVHSFLEALDYRLGEVD